MPNTLTLRLLNDSAPIDEGRWKWSVWLEGPDAELDQVKEVRYMLHPTFPKPIRVITDRASKFKLESSGWGEFSIAAQLVLANGKTESLERWLRLEGREEQPDDRSRRRPRVFLSGSGIGIGRAFISKLGVELHNQGVDLVTADDISIVSESAVADSAGGAVSASDVVAIVLSRGYANTAQSDVAAAQASQKVVVPILIGPSVATPAALSDLEPIHVNNANQATQVADLLASRAKNVFFSDY